MVILDFECFKYDWLMVFVDTNTKKCHCIVNDKHKLEKFYEYYKNEVIIGYNISHYDRFIMQAILCDFDPYLVNDFIINKEQQGWQYSKMFNRFPLVFFDTMVKDKSLKQCEASLGLRIMETSVGFNIDRKLTNSELTEVLEYCKHDVYSTLEVFMQGGFFLSPQDEWSSSVDILKEFNFPISFLSKTKAQLGCHILGATKQPDMNDEFEIIIPNNIILGKYEFVKDWFVNKENHWYSKLVDGRKQPIKNEFKTNIAGLEHTFAWGGVHAGIEREIVDGILLNCDFASLYPNIMVEYDLISRGIPNKKRYVQLLETRLRLKREHDGREKCYKIALNGSYGQMGYKNGPMYDKKMANNVCIHGQLIALDLVEKLEKVSSVLMTNTDGVLVKVNREEDVEKVKNICEEVSKRVRIGIDIERYKRYVAKDVNNYIAVCENGKIKAKGSYVKFLNPFERSMSIVGTAIRNYFVYGTSVEQTVMNSSDIMDFQIIAKAGRKYEYCMQDGKILNEKTNRVFATKDINKGTIYKKHKLVGNLCKVEMTPEHCLIINEDVRKMEIPNEVDKQWYINLAKKRIKEFVK